MPLESTLQLGLLLAAVVTSCALSSLVGMLAMRFLAPPNALGRARKGMGASPGPLDPAGGNGDGIVQPMSGLGQRPSHPEITSRPRRVAWYRAPARHVPPRVPTRNFPRR